MQGFRKVDPDRWEFSNDCFVKGHKQMLHEIHRRKNAGGSAAQNTQLTPVAAIEVCPFFTSFTLLLP